MKLRPRIRPETRLEWEVKDEINAIQAIRPPERDSFSHHPSKKSSRRWHLVVLAGALLLLASVIAVARLVERAERNIAMTERDVELAVEADAFLQDSAAPKPHIQSIELQNDHAIIHISAAEGVPSAGKPVADVTVVYHQSARGWERVEPDEPGQTARDPSRYQATAHILFQYQQEDQSLVEAVVPAIEAFTTDLQRDIGLDRPLAPEKVPSEKKVHEKITVRIAIVAATQPPAPTDPNDPNDPTAHFELVGYIARDSNGIIVLAPRLASIPTTLATADSLTQALKAAVAYRTILFAVEEHQPQAVWRPLVDGLQLWAYSMPREFDSDLAKNMNDLLHQQLANKASLRLPPLSILPSPLRETEQSHDLRWQQSVLAKSVIDYAIATYGRHSLARLFAAMHQVDSWQSLIPAVYSVSAEEFETRWQAYLAAQSDLHGLHP